jgi:hypothetical protein
LPSSTAKSSVLKNVPRGSGLTCVSGKCSSHRTIHVASTDKR